MAKRKRANSKAPNVPEKAAAGAMSDGFREDERSRYEHLNPKNLTPDMPVLVTGVVAGQIVPSSEWPNREIPSQEFPNLAAAQEVFPDLNLKKWGKRFRGPTADIQDGRIWARFDSEAVWERLSGW